MSDFVIRTRNLTKYFGAKCVVRDLNLNVPRGSIYGFLGRNGSGKTTSLRMILGLLAPNWGTSTILGHDSQQLPPEVRARIGYLAEGHPVCGWMRVKDAEAYQSRFYPQWNHELFSSVLDFFRVDPKNRARSLARRTCGTVPGHGAGAGARRAGPGRPGHWPRSGGALARCWSP